MGKTLKNVTLVIMAAGIGSRFGKGIKQLEPVGPNGELIMDYSIFDARLAGFNKVVFVIRREIEKEFQEMIGNRISKEVEVFYVYQELQDIPEKYQGKAMKRSKPWGTGQAILCCKDVVKEPFLIINADDYYGREAYEKAYDYLTGASSSNEFCMISFILENTLSKNGTVTRGICKVDKNDMLTKIEETHHIRMNGDCTSGFYKNMIQVISKDSVVSMNMWGCFPWFFDVLSKEFEDFLESEKTEDAEFLLPTIIGNLLEQNKISVKVLQTKEKWFGITYKEDAEEIVTFLKKNDRGRRVSIGI